jgi:hypothetical protein
VDVLALAVVTCGTSIHMTCQVHTIRTTCGRVRSSDRVGDVEEIDQLVFDMCHKCR